MSDYEQFARIHEREMKLNPMPSAMASSGGLIFLPQRLYSRLLDLAEERGKTVVPLIEDLLDREAGL